VILNSEIILIKYTNLIECLILIPTPNYTLENDIAKELLMYKARFDNASKDKIFFGLNELRDMKIYILIQFLTYCYNIFLIVDIKRIDIQ
jgi:hypothetical protein